VRRRAVWLINEEIEEQLDAFAGSTSNPTMYLPAGFNGSPTPLLKGRPVLVVEQCPALGSVGDIIVADLSHYIIVDGGLTPALSAHVNFMSDQTVWRFTLRVDGQPAFASAITPFKGNTTRSPFVTLAAR